MARAYLDHASTTPPRPEAVAALTQWATLPTGDPGRLHEEGRTVRDALEAARGQVAELVGVAGRQVVFTSGATESINAAVWGATRAAPGRPVLCAAVEHSAVRDASARLAPTEDIAVDGAGRLQVDALRERLQSGSLPRPALVHCQWGEPRGRDAPARAPGRLAVPGGRHHRPRGRRRSLRARAHGPRRARRRPGQHQRAQARRGARCRCADRAAWQPVRASARGRGAGTWPPRRARGAPGPARLRRCGRRAGRRRSARR